MNNQFTGSWNSFNAFENNGGLNTSASPLAVKDFESTDLQNVELDIWGSITKRAGYLNLNSAEVNSGASGNGVFFYENSSGTDYLVSIFGDKLYKMDSLDGTFDAITGAITLTASQDNQAQFKTYNNILFGVNYSDAPFKWTGSGNAAAMGVPTNLTQAKCIENWTEYMFLANVTVGGVYYGSRMYWSGAGTPDTFDAADWVNINANDGTDIIAIKALGDKLVIFKERSIHVGIFTGDTDIPFVFAKTPSHVGCIARDSVQEVNNGLIFLSYDGFYYFDGSNSLKISNNISYTLRNDCAKSRFPKAVSTLLMEKNQYLCFVTDSGDSTNQTGFIWDFYTKAWMKYVGASVNAITRIHTSYEERPYFLDYSGFCYRMNTGTNDYPLGVLTAIDAYYKTKWFSFADLMNQKGIPHVMMYLAYNNASLTVGYSFDFEDANQYSVSLPLNSSSSAYGSAVYGTATYAGAGGFTKRIDLTGRGRVFRLSFENSAPSETFKINGFGISAYLETAS
jgi:hypothetical protein